MLLKNVSLRPILICLILGYNIFLKESDIFCLVKRDLVDFMLVLLHEFVLHIGVPLLLLHLPMLFKRVESSSPPTLLARSR